MGIVDTHRSAEILRFLRTRRVFMNKQVTTIRIFVSTLFFLFIVGVAFFGRGAPTVLAYTTGTVAVNNIWGSSVTFTPGFSVAGQVNSTVAVRFLRCTFDNALVSQAQTTTPTGCDNAGSVYTAGAYGFALYQAVTLNLDCTSNNTTNFDCDVESMSGGVDGQYWFYIYSPNNDNGNLESVMYPLQRVSGVWSTTLASGVSINTPADNAVLMDFPDWNISWGSLGSDLKQLGIHYSDDATVLADCEEFPWGSGAGYTDCINGSPRIWTDYGVATTVASGSSNIPKARTLTLGTTYYAQAVVQEVNAYGTNVAVSDIISFQIGIPIGAEIDPADCGTFDIICYIQAGATWLFVPSATSINNFSNLTLENSFPFSYVYDMGELYNDLFDQSASDFDLTVNLMGSDFTIISTDMLEAISFQSLVRTIMGAIAMFFTGLFIYRKIIKIHDNNHQTV